MSTLTSGRTGTVPAAPVRRQPKPASRRARRFWLGLAVVVATIYMAFPFYWLAISSVTAKEVLFSGSLVPQAWSIQNYVELFQNTPILTYFMNSVIVAVTVTALTVVVSVLGAYSLVFFRYPFRDTIGRVILFTYMFPGVIIIVPTYGLLSRMRLIDNLYGLILIELVLTVPFCMWMLRSFFLQIPKDLEEAALLDGASRLRILVSVLVPVATPGIISIAVFAFIFSWNEYLFPLVLLNSESQKTLPLGVAGYMGHLYVEWGPLLASGVFATLPILLLFMFLQRFLVSGLMSGAVKG